MAAATATAKKYFCQEEAVITRGWMYRLGLFLILFAVARISYRQGRVDVCESFGTEDFDVKRCVRDGNGNGNGSRYGSSGDGYGDGDGY